MGQEMVAVEEVVAVVRIEGTAVNTQDCLGLPSFMVIKSSVIGLPWLHGIESEGASCGH